MIEAPQLARDGAVKLVGCEDGFAGVRRMAHAIYAERERLFAARAMPEASMAPFRRRYIALAEIVEPVSLLPAAVKAIADAELGTGWAPTPTCFVRTIVPGSDDARLPFHQDERLEGRKLINVWMPLDPCGVDAPGLEIILSSQRRLLEIAPKPGAHYPVERAEIDEETAVAAGSAWHPACEPGDALVFFGTTPHRTYIVPGMTKPRSSIEIRLFLP